MKTQHNRTIYRCDHCNKLYLTAGPVARHEQYCPRNPANAHACFGCENLIVGEETAEGRRLRTFTCAAFDRRMYSYVAERRRLVPLMPDAMRMPNECIAFAPETLQHMMNSTTPNQPF